MRRDKFRTILFSKFSEFVVTPDKPEYPENNKSDPDDLNNDKSYNRVKQLFKSMHINDLAPETCISNLFKSKQV